MGAAGATILEAGAAGAVGAGAGAAIGGAAALAGLGLGAGIAPGVKPRSINLAAGAGAGAGVGGKTKISGLKMQAMALGGSGGAVLAKELAVSPAAVVVSREKEKLALQELNDRFAAYIERVRFLEADNKRLQGTITVLTLKFESLDAALRAIYEEELKAARLALDKTTAAKGAAELRAYNAETKLKEVTALYSAEAAAHLVTKESIPQLEKMISERDSQIDFLTKNMSALDIELKRIKGQSSALQSDLAVAKQDRDAETVARVELESFIQTKEDEMVFMKAM